MMTIQAEMGTGRGVQTRLLDPSCEDRCTLLASYVVRTFCTSLSFSVPAHSSGLSSPSPSPPTMSLETEKIDHEMTDHNGTNIASTGSSLSRQVTVALSPEQYERLFFQPSAPRKGDLAKRFGTLPHPLPHSLRLRNEIIANNTIPT
jgi:hypothetical protein